MIKILSIQKLLWVSNRYTICKNISIFANSQQKLWSLKIGNFEFNLTRNTAIPSSKDTFLTESLGVIKYKGDPIERNFPYKARIISFKRDTVKSEEDNSNECTSDSDGELKKENGKMENTTLGKGKVTNKTSGKGEVENTTSSKKEGAVTADKKSMKENKQKRTGSKYRKRCRSTSSNHCKNLESDMEQKQKQSKVKLNKPKFVKSSSTEKELVTTNSSTTDDGNKENMVEEKLVNTSLNKNKTIIKPDKKFVKNKPQPICQRDSSVSTINCCSSEIPQQSGIPLRIKPSRSTDKNLNITNPSINLSETNKTLTESLSKKENIFSTNNFSCCDSNEGDKTRTQSSEVALISKIESINADTSRKTVKDTVSKKGQPLSTRECVDNTFHDYDLEYMSRNKKSKIDSLSQNLMNFCSSFNSAKKRAEILKKVPTESLSPREHVISTIYDSVESSNRSNREYKDPNISSSSRCSYSDHENGEVKPKRITNSETNNNFESCGYKSKSQHVPQSSDYESWNENNTVNYNGRGCKDNVNTEEINHKSLMKKDKTNSNSCSSDFDDESSCNKVDLSSKKNYNCKITDSNEEQQTYGTQILSHEISRNDPMNNESCSDNGSIEENVGYNRDPSAKDADYTCAYSDYINQSKDHTDIKKIESLTYEKDAFVNNCLSNRNDNFRDLQIWPKLVARSNKNKRYPTINYVKDYYNKYTQGKNNNLNLERNDKVDVESNISEFCELAEMQLLGEMIEKDNCREKGHPSDTKSICKQVNKLADLEKNSKE